MNTLNLAVNETNTAINFTLNNSAGTAINITGYTIRFKIRKNVASANTNDSGNTCTITSAANGQFSYQFTSTDLPSAGDYYGQLQITFPNSTVHIVPKYIRIVAEEKY